VTEEKTEIRWITREDQVSPDKKEFIITKDENFLTTRQEVEEECFRQVVIRLIYLLHKETEDQKGERKRLRLDWQGAVSNQKAQKE